MYFKLQHPFNTIYILYINTFVIHNNKNYQWCNEISVRVVLLIISLIILYLLLLLNILISFKSLYCLIDNIG